METIKKVYKIKHDINGWKLVEHTMSEYPIYVIALYNLKKEYRYLADHYDADGNKCAIYGTFHFTDLDYARQFYRKPTNGCKLWEVFEDDKTGEIVKWGRRY